MHPTPSIIFFTVSSGAGIGMLMLLLALQEFGPGASFPLGSYITAGVLAFLLVVAGLISSTFHLANPRNAWKAFNRIRSSWLSREGVSAVLLLLATVVYFAHQWWAAGESSALTTVLATMILILGLLTLITTGMIYASLKPIPQWRNPLVPVAFVTLGMASGAVVLTAFAGFTVGVDPVLGAATLALLGLAILIKAAYYLWIGTSRGPTIQRATGMTQAQVRLMDTGHSHQTFLTREFGRNLLSKTGSGLFRAIVFGIGFFVPALATAAMIGSTGPFLGILAVTAMFFGMAVERWLFFVEAQHVVNLYHGRQSV